MKIATPLLASLLVAWSALSACRPMPQGTAAPTPAPPAPSHSSQPWLLPAATLEESMAQLNLHTYLQTYQKVLQQTTEANVEIGMAKARSLEETDPEMIALNAKIRGLDDAHRRLLSMIRSTRDDIDNQRATWIQEQDRRRAEAAEKMSGDQ